MRKENKHYQGVIPILKNAYSNNEICTVHVYAVCISVKNKILKIWPVREFVLLILIDKKLQNLKGPRHAWFHLDNFDEMRWNAKYLC